MTKGRFITFEGGEGTGKSTQAKRLAATLESAGYDVQLTREPGGTFGAESIRELVLSGTQDRWSGMTELLLMYAARIDHVEKLIKPALERGAWVISDRFADSSMAYQGYARGLGKDRVEAVHNAVMEGFEPDMTILFDMDPVIAMKRVETRGEDLSRFDSETMEFHNTLREAFLEIAEDNVKRTHTIDASASREAVQTRIHHLVTSQFPDVANAMISKAG